MGFKIKYSLFFLIIVESKISLSNKCDEILLFFNKEFFLDFKFWIIISSLIQVLLFIYISGITDIAELIPLYSPFISLYLKSPKERDNDKEKRIKELEKNEKIDKNLLRYLTVKVKKLDLETDYFKKNDETTRNMKAWKKEI